VVLLWAMARIRVQPAVGSNLSQPIVEMLIKIKEEKRIRAAKSLMVLCWAGVHVTSKNRDKPIKHTVRVRFSGPFKMLRCLDPVLCHRFLISL
jgi:hypothetical protein